MTTPFNLWKYAAEFRDAAKLLSDHVKQTDGLAKLGVMPNVPTYYMLCHGIELALKAYIRCFDDDNYLRRVLGHDLLKTYNRATELALPDLVTLDDRFVSVLGVANQSYKAKDLEYSNVGFRNLYLPNVLFDGLNAILDGTRQACFDATVEQRKTGDSAP